MSDVKDDDDDEYSMTLNNEDDFQVSTSFKQSKKGLGASLSPTKTTKGNGQTKLTPAQERLRKLEEEDEREKKAARLKAIKAEQAAKLKETLGESSDERDESDEYSDDAPQQTQAAKKPQKKPELAIDKIMKKMGKGVQESSEFSMDDFPEDSGVLESGD